MSDSGIHTVRGIQFVSTGIAHVTDLRLRSPKKLSITDSSLSGSISKIAAQILSNPPHDPDPHHGKLELGHAHNAGKCSRQIWFKSHIIRDEQPNPAPVMVMGKAIHDWFDSAVENSEYKDRILVKQFVDFRPKYNVVGRADFVSPNSIGELKTSKSWAFKFLDAPQEDHVLQSSIYAHYFNRRYIEIIYLARDTGQFKTFFWPALRGIESEIERISSISTLHNPPEKLTWDGKKLNPWTEVDAEGNAKTPWQCKYCPFKKECLEIDNAGWLSQRS